MLPLRRVPLTYSYCRHLMTTAAMSINYFARQGKFMKKLMREDAPKKKWHMSRPGRTQEAFRVDTSKIISPHVTRRVAVLNKLFMTYITDLMTTGEMSAQLVGRGIEVSRVQLSNEFHVVRVYWFSSTDDLQRMDENTKLLEQISFKLRHELSQLKVIGVVPPVVFVKDKAIAASAELQKRLAEADYGEDYVPLERKPPAKPQLTLFKPLPEDVRKKILETTGDDEEVTGAEEEALYIVDLPPMRHDVLNLNHWKIMSRVKESLNKIRGVELAKKEWSPLDYQQPFDPESVRLSQQNTSEEMKAFDDFLLKRMIEEKRRDRLELKQLNSNIFDNEAEQDDDGEDYDLEEEEYTDPFDNTDSQETLR